LLADVPEPLLKEATGHSDAMDTLEVYGHYVIGETERTANILNGVYSTNMQ